MSGEELIWRKSSRSGNNSNGNCVEVAITAPGIAMRDSKNPQGGQLKLPASGWHAFLTHTAASH